MCTNFDKIFCSIEPLCKKYAGYVPYSIYLLDLVVIRACMMWQKTKKINRQTGKICIGSKGLQQPQVNQLWFITNKISLFLVIFSIFQTCSEIWEWTCLWAATVLHPLFVRLRPFEAEVTLVCTVNYRVTVFQVNCYLFTDYVRLCYC